MRNATAHIWGIGGRHDLISLSVRSRHAGILSANQNNSNIGLIPGNTANGWMQVFPRRVRHTGTTSFLAGKISHVTPSPWGVCPEGRRTRVTQWLKTRKSGKKMLRKRTRQHWSCGLTEKKWDRPSLLHAKEDFPVVQPAVIIRISINLVAQSETY